ncbi:protein of unknown function [Aliiroseovarius halocynthiae]|uniref:DUF4177 domain-containing protein n=1 Tax=Aliiroseovarius halocynthiae TaxID=985055 RepID=A0A545SWS9_9RHOB|nr:DUF4177 domain-containing protein [Aliiroseovarius halocynthiae]TQV69410.1 DUF4177 domain-containing protein [Aliiroseovarius halocynthiae]SMR72803.1 protein of unknown function [Aliiroseovarius halocynthiae]
MTRYEYQVIPAPRKGKKARGVKGTEARFAYAMQEALNDEAAEGWEYVRTDTLPSEERSGLTGRTTIYQNLLVFRRRVEELSDDVESAADAAPAEAKTPKVEVKDEGDNNAPTLPSATDANEAGDAAPSIERDDR